MFHRRLVSEGVQGGPEVDVLLPHDLPGAEAGQHAHLVDDTNLQVVDDVRLEVRVGYGLALPGRLALEGGGTLADLAVMARVQLEHQLAW